MAYRVLLTIEVEEEWVDALRPALDHLMDLADAADFVPHLLPPEIEKYPSGGKGYTISATAVWIPSMTESTDKSAASQVTA